MPREHRHISVSESIAVVTALTLGVVRLMYERYYRALGTSVDQIGLTNWKMISVSALVGLQLVGLALPALGLAAFMRRRTGTTGPELRGATTRQKAEAHVTHWFLIAPTYFFTACLILLPVVGRTILLVAAIAGLTAAILSVLEPRWVHEKEFFSLMRRYFLQFITFGLLAWLLIVWLFAGSAARSLDANSLGNTGETLLLDIGAQAVCITNLLDGATSLATDRPLVLLGGSGGTYVLRDTVPRQTHLVPSGTIALTVLKGSKATCG